MRKKRMPGSFAAPRRRNTRKPNSAIWLPFGMAALLAVIWVGLSMFQIAVPFLTWNPFEKVVTIGEKTIDEWKYGGLSPSGNLEFYNNFNTVSIPPSQGRFDADGSYILIRGYTTDTLTIESRMDFLWRFATTAFTLLAVLAAASFFFLTRLKKARRFSVLNLGRKRKKARVHLFKGMAFPPPGSQTLLKAWRWKRTLSRWKSKIDRR